MTPETSATTGERRVLVLVNDNAGKSALPAAIDPDLDPDPGGRSSTVHVVVPAFNSRIRRWLSDEDGARQAAEQRLESCLAELDRAGIAATGAVGDCEPLQALEDSLRGFAADRIVIASAPPDETGGVDGPAVPSVAAEAKRRFGLSVAHVYLLSARRRPAGDRYLSAA